jgi:hypothetical protein
MTPTDKAAALVVSRCLREFPVDKERFVQIVTTVCDERQIDDTTMVTLTALADIERLSERIAEHECTAAVDLPDALDWGPDDDGTLVIPLLDPAGIPPVNDEAIEAVLAGRADADRLLGDVVAKAGGRDG